nr:methylmalonyl Co-A mutase-associated GTPase MeaB [Candidatus Sigynarchaeota archaeon]
MEIDDLVTRMKQGDRRAVGRLISLAENDLAAARGISARIFKDTGKAYIVGVTGAPGAGKSSLVNQLIQLLVNKGARLGIVCVDPTSPFSGGALLGDRIRMKEDYPPGQVFIRSMASRGKLGGIARATKDTISILDAFGLDYIIVETVGVGQNEIDIYNTAYTTLVLLAPGMGDEVQTFKAGIMETSDIYVVNKMDHEGADRLVSEIESMLDLGENTQLTHDDNHVITAIKKSSVAGWRPSIKMTNSLTGEGVSDLWDEVLAHKAFLETSGMLRQRLEHRFKNEIVEILRATFTYHLDEALDPSKNAEVKSLLEAAISRSKSPYDISDSIGKFIIKKIRR